MNKHKRYRLYTEYQKNIQFLTSKYFESYTIYNVRGYWNGISEYSVVIEIISDNIDILRLLYSLAEDIKLINEQETVLLTIEDIDVIFV